MSTTTIQTKMDGKLLGFIDYRLCQGLGLSPNQKSVLSSMGMKFFGETKRIKGRTSGSTNMLFIHDAVKKGQGRL